MGTRGADEDTPIMRMLPMSAMGGDRDQMKTRYWFARMSLRLAREAFELAEAELVAKKKTVLLATACAHLVDADDSRVDARTWRPT